MKKTLLGNKSMESNQNSSSIVNALIQHVLNSNTQSRRRLNPIESDIMRKLLSEKNIHHPQANVRTEMPPQRMTEPPIVENQFEKEDIKNLFINPLKVNQKAENKKIEVKENTTSRSENVALYSSEPVHQILEHESIMERAKRLLGNSYESKLSHK
jgi:hypothetical protein